jgi:hypothetical protein
VALGEGRRTPVGTTAIFEPNRNLQLTQPTRPRLDNKIDTEQPALDSRPIAPTGYADDHSQAITMIPSGPDLVILVAHDRDDTFDRCAAADGKPLSDILWLALHGNSTARRVVDAMVNEFIDQVMAQEWPGEKPSRLRADATVRLHREVRQRMAESTERHAWRWN